MPKRRKSRSETQAAFDFSRLEPRQLLATNVWVDFGTGFAPELTIDDAQSAALNGPQVFGGGQTLKSLESSVIDLNRDFTGDGNVDSMDVDALIEQMSKQLERIFDPYDINLQFVTSTSLTQIGTTLQSAASNDAYIFVAGEDMDGGPDFGASLIDPGNTVDNLGFVFSDQPLANSNSSDPMHRITWSISRAIARHAAHTFGLLTTEANLIARHDIMALPGTDLNGNRLRDNSAYTGGFFFTQWELAQQTVNGVSPGTQNSYDALVAAVGTRPGGPFYVTGNGDYNTITVTRASATTADITVDDREIMGADISNGLILEDGANTAYSLFNQFQIDAAITQAIDVRASKNNRLKITNGVGNFMVNGHAAGTLNSNVIFEGITGILGDSEDDSATVGNGGYVANISLGAGNDMVTTLPGLIRMPNVNLGDGDDTVVVEGTGDGGILSGGNGTDTARSDTSGMSLLSGGYQFGLGFARYSSIENVVGAPGHNSRFQSYFSNTNLRVVIDGSEATVYRKIGSNLVFLHQLTNFNQFQLSTRHRVSEIVVHNTDYDLMLQAGRSITVSSTMDLQQSELSGIEHQIQVSGGDPDLIVSNRLAADALNVRVEGRVVTGMTAMPISTSAQFRNIILHGSANPDQFLLVGTNHLGRTIHGYEGADLFSVGSVAIDMSLSDLGRLVMFDGGAGDDRVYVNDRAYEAKAAYRLTDQFVTPLEDSNLGLATRMANGQGIPVRGIQLDSIRFVTVEGTSDHSDYFQVYPSDTTRFIIDGHDSGTAISSGLDAGDVLQLKGPFNDGRQHLVREGQNNGTWYWNGGFRSSVVFDDIEHLSGVDRLAIGTENHSQSEPVVRVYDPVAREVLFDIQAYEEGFTGGVRVETADFNMDGVPDIVAAPGPRRSTDIRVFDGRTGDLMTEFQAYHPDYRGGVDVAAGFVIDGQGETPPQIVTATSRGLPKVRVFQWNEANNNFEMELEFIAFGSPGYDSGAKISVGDVKGDNGVQDIVVASGEGRSPQVFVYQLSEGFAFNTHNFLAAAPDYRGGLDVATGNVSGTPPLDLVAGHGMTTLASDPQNGRFRAYDNALIPPHPGGQIGAAFTVKAYLEPTTMVHVDVKDLDLDGVADRIFTAQGRTGTSRLIKAFDPESMEVVDQIFAADPFFAAGFHIG